MSYVLIAVFWLSSYGVTSQAVLFPSKEACEAAITALSKPGFRASRELACVPLGVSL